MFGSLHAHSFIPLMASKFILIMKILQLQHLMVFMIFSREALLLLKDHLKAEISLEDIFISFLDSDMFILQIQ